MIPALPPRQRTQQQSAYAPIPIGKRMDEDEAREPDKGALDITNQRPFLAQRIQCRLDFLRVQINLAGGLG